MKKSLIIGVLAAIFSIPAYADFQYELGVDYFYSDTEVENRFVLSDAFSDLFTPDFFDNVMVTDREVEIPGFDSIDFSEVQFPDSNSVPARWSDIGNSIPLLNRETVASDRSITDNGFSVNGVVYFQSVDTSKGPLSEAAFLDKSSNIGVSFRDISDSDLILANTRIVFGNDFIFEGAYQYTDFNNPYSVSVGKYITDTSDIVLTYLDFDLLGVKSFDLSSHSVIDLGVGSYLGIDLNVGYVDFRGGNTSNIGFELTYFGAPNWGIGIDGSTQLEGDGPTEYSLFSEYFFTENAAASLRWQSSQNEVGFVSNETTLITVEGIVRF